MKVCCTLPFGFRAHVLMGFGDRVWAFRRFRAEACGRFRVRDLGFRVCRVYGRRPPSTMVGCRPPSEPQHGRADQAKLETCVAVAP